MEFVLIILVFLLAVELFAILGEMAAMRERSALGWTLLGFVITPIGAFFLLLVMGRARRRQVNHLSSRLRKAPRRRAQRV